MKTKATQSLPAPRKSSRSRLYVGVKHNREGWEVFRSIETPIFQTHGEQYAAVIGPFRTRRGAEFMAHPVTGRSNPHCRTVADAERLAAIHARKG